MDPVTVTFDINQLIRSGLTVKEFFLCYLIYDNKYIQLKFYEKVIEKIDPIIYKILIDKGYCKSKVKGYSPTNISLLKTTEKFNVIAGKKENVVDNWIDEWIDLWPKGVLSGGYYIKGDKRTSKYKMKSFIKNYPEFSKDVIFKATQKYIMRMSIENYKYSKLSHYFITKDSNSTLASECLALKDEEFSYESNTTHYGESEL